jgi:hypothetical protein
MPTSTYIDVVDGWPDLRTIRFCERNHVPYASKLLSQREYHEWLTLLAWDSNGEKLVPNSSTKGG